MSNPSELHDKLQERPFLAGYEPTEQDAKMFDQIFGGNKTVANWAAAMSNYTVSERIAVQRKPKIASPEKSALKKQKTEKAQDQASAEPANFLRELIKKDLSKGGRIHDRVGRTGDVVRTRFPPEPNGYLHIGHAKSICLNFGFAAEFGGRCHLRFDDTNPASEKQEYIDAIRSDVKWLGFDWGEHNYYASSYFDQLYTWAEYLITEGKAYVDSQTKEEARINRGTVTKKGKNSPFRDRSVEENLKLFREMRDGKHPEGAHMLRAKIDMGSANMNMRDPGLYRVLHKEHPHTGNKWCIYPIYDFAHGQEDAIEGITHSFCTLEFDQHRPLYDWFLDNLPIPGKEKCRPIQTEFAKLVLKDVVLSKRNLKVCVENKVVTGWDDPRMPTLCGLRRRGIPPAAIRRFCEDIGVTRNFSVVDTAKLDDVVREELDVNCERRFAALSPIKVTITDLPADFRQELKADNHPKNPSMGSRPIIFTPTIYIDHGDFMFDPPADYFRLKPNGEAMLRTCGIIIKVNEVVQDPTTKAVVELKCTHEKAGNRKVAGHIGWVSADDCVFVTANVYEPLFKVGVVNHEEEADADAEAGAEGEEEDAAEDEEKKLASHDEARQKVLKMVNENSIRAHKAVVEKNLATAAPETSFQFERLGYFVVDKNSTPDNIVFNRTITLRASGPEKDTGRSRKAEQEEQMRLKKLLEDLPASEMFKIQKDKYSKFDADGIPTHDAKGTELSKGAIKKLKKEAEKQTKKLAAKK
eukprot:TRINITY_DN2691_c0_g1_i6.p1 TRINITY_DN2691_c0_g1~~TRINITY_DN2691_c0_g1_i6.p1  ORF type:complete len:751 (+),score=193.89 TRINITY_DN2691_c0_g1_i6:47-2299(+)